MFENNDTLLYSHSSSSSSPPNSGFNRDATSSSYIPHEWSLLSISKPSPLASSTSRSSVSILTVTLLYLPTQTLFAWPFNLSQPDAKGVCYVTPFVDGAKPKPLEPPKEIISTSLSVLFDVVKTYMRVKRKLKEKQAQYSRNHLDSTGSNASHSYSSGRGQMVDEITTLLHLEPIDPLKRDSHLTRQKLPCWDNGRGIDDLNSIDKHPHNSSDMETRSQVLPPPQSLRSSISSQETNLDLASDADSTVSSKATSESDHNHSQQPSPPIDQVEPIGSKPSSSAKDRLVKKPIHLGKINTQNLSKPSFRQSIFPNLGTKDELVSSKGESSLPSAKVSKSSSFRDSPNYGGKRQQLPPAPIQVPQIRLVEATPLDLDYAERAKVLGEPTMENDTPMETLDEDEFSDDRQDYGDDDDDDDPDHTWNEIDGVTIIKIHPCDRIETPFTSKQHHHRRTSTEGEEGEDPHSTHRQNRRSVPLSASPFQQNEYKEILQPKRRSTSSIPSPSAVVHSSIDCPTPFNVKIETIEKNSPDSILTYHRSSPSCSSCSSSLTKPTSMATLFKRSSFEFLNKLGLAGSSTSSKRRGLF